MLLGKWIPRILVVMSVGALFAIVPAQANGLTLEERIELADVAGLSWLAAQQNADGSFGPMVYCDRVAYTSLATLKFESRAIETGFDPLEEAYEYSDVVQAGLNFIVANSYLEDISSEPEADADGDGFGRLFNDCPAYTNHEVYNTSTAMMALAASGHPEIYGDLLQDAVDVMAFAQADPSCGPHRGGWRYVCDQCNSDNSNTGYVTLALGYAAAPPPYGFEIAAPDYVMDELEIWLDTIQFRSTGHPDDGASRYDPYSEWFNILKNGNLMYEMALVGMPMEDEDVQAALGYIERHWSVPGAGGEGWLNHCQAMFTMMKGFQAFGIDVIDVAGVETEWFPVVAEHLLASQHADGSWGPDPWGNHELATTWALLTLEKAVPQIENFMGVDVKPGSCPNPINFTSGGVVPVAITGTADFDVTQIDPATVRLNDIVAPIRWNVEDVATPFEPFMEKENALDCHEFTGDGYMDLTLKFAKEDVIAVLGEANKGDVMLLTLTGNLKADFGGTPCIGLDVIVVR